MTQKSRCFVGIGLQLNLLITLSLKKVINLLDAEDKENILVDDTNCDYRKPKDFKQRN